QRTRRLLCDMTPPAPRSTLFPYTTLFRSADRCDIYTDVDGVYTTDPRVVPKARRLDKIAFEDMLELASQGAKVLQVRSVELGMVDRKSTRLNSSHVSISYAVFCLNKTIVR